MHCLKYLMVEVELAPLFKDYTESDIPKYGVCVGLQSIISPTSINNSNTLWRGTQGSRAVLDGSARVQHFSEPFLCLDPIYCCRVLVVMCHDHDLAMLGTNIEPMHLGFALDLDLFPTYIFHSFLTYLISFSLCLHSTAEQP